MKRILLIAGLALSMIPFGAEAQGRGNGHGKNKADKQWKQDRDEGIYRDDDGYDPVNGKGKNKANKQWKRDRDNGIYRGDDGYGYGQVRGNGRRGGGPPPWAPAHGYRAKQHVYFPDYYTYYDSRRNGYVYWGGNNWSFSRNVPSFLNGVNLGSARMQALPLGWTALPENYYRDYARSYPANTVNISIPIPPL